MSNYTCPQLQEEQYAGVPFSQVPSNCCRPIHVQPFTFDLHLFGFECNQNGGFFAAIIVLTIIIKVLQNFLGTWVGQLERELMQLQPAERKCRGKKYGICGSRKQCPKFCGKLGYLIWLEVVGGVIGILSILVITGNNFWIWLTIILANSGGVYFAVWKANPDHHSPAAEFLNLVKNAEAYSNYKNEDELRKAHEAILELKRVWDTIEMTDTRPNDGDQQLTLSVRKRLVL